MKRARSRARCCAVGHGGGESPCTVHKTVAASDFASIRNDARCGRSTATSTVGWGAQWNGGSRSGVVVVVVRFGSLRERELTFSSHRQLLVAPDNFTGKGTRTLSRLQAFTAITLPRFVVCVYVVAVGDDRSLYCPSK
ncbi:hypothetical protein PTSG_10790 [Salpingoeca rosetta]|uniref:Uncharacterized protein n=1 Tax=Salpingoeca rosetta (strain ATCC 50818 / BSB-021) TaxID=946362 RepID=F2UPX7_SALR5|nr:uncharacterized protein PTSG_10790 [Salpingoeca rosetta]EGD79807.1 hypothetical protein PTSG_10790 [Salpingoeca rosetta]|eukprot:XP_004988756.1 hypothetical protein PTSG_10790 [Salpingoeca rosetta]